LNAKPTPKPNPVAERQAEASGGIEIEL